MPQQLKLTKELNLMRRAAFNGMNFAPKTANFSVPALNASGTYYIATGNVTKEINFTLPLANACNGDFWYFGCLNAAKVIITGTTTNSIFAAGISVNAVHGVTAVNSHPSATRFGKFVTVFSDGTRYYLQSPADSNAYITRYIED